jgi:hypothetical protein
MKGRKPQLFAVTTKNRHGINSHEQGAILAKKLYLTLFTMRCSVNSAVKALLRKNPTLDALFP